MACFVCYRRLNYEVTHRPDGELMSTDENASKFNEIIELLTVKVDDRIKAPLMFLHDQQYATIVKYPPITGPESIYSQTYNRCPEALREIYNVPNTGNAPVRLKPLPINAHLINLIAKYDLCIEQMSTRVEKSSKIKKARDTVKTIKKNIKCKSGNDDETELEREKCKNSEKLNRKKNSNKRKRIIVETGGVYYALSNG